MGDVPGPSTAPYFNSKKATENFARLCQLIVTLCSDLFRDILSRNIKPADLRSEVDKNRKKLERLLNSQQKEQIYPMSGTTTLTSKDLDISVLYTLLRNICKIPDHANGWGNPPLNGDTCLSACIERIRIQRNSISAHSTIAEIDDTKFQDDWDDLKNSILEIEKQLIGGDMYERGVNELLSCDLNPTRSEKYVKEFKNIQGELLIKEEKMEIIESSLRTTRHRVAVKRERVDNIESTMKTHERQLTVKRARLDKLERRQSLHTSQIKAIHTKLRTMQGYERHVKMPQIPPHHQHDDVKNSQNKLSIACRNADLETTRHIIQTYPYLLHSVDNNGWNAAFHAAKGGNVQILQLLTDKGVDIKNKNNDNSNILHVACFNSNLEMSRYITQTYPELLHCVDNHGGNAALHAASGGNGKILRLLAENKVDVKHTLNDGLNILHVACQNSNLEMSRHIIQTCPDLLHGVDTNGYNAALFAAEGGNIKILKLLADEGVDVKHKDAASSNILHVACQYSNLEMSNYIIQTYPDLLHSVDNNGWNAALHTTCGVNVKILQLLSDYGVEVKHKDNDGCNILHVACFYSNSEMIRYIIQTYPDLLHSVDNNGWNPALCAAEGGKIEILQLLADNEVDVKHENDDGLNILHIACSVSKLEMSRYIAKTYPDLLHSVDKYGRNAALFATIGQNVKILQLLADNDVDVKCQSKDGWNILHVACQSSNLEVSRFVIQTYPDFLHSVDRQGMNAALHAAMGGNIEILQLLAENEVDVKHKTNQGLNILHLGCCYSNLEMSRYIIETYPDLLHSVDRQGMNAASHAARGGNIEILQLLAENEVDVKHKTNQGLNILHLGCCDSNLEMSRYIIETYPDLLHSVDRQGMNAALHAARGGNIEILQLLAKTEVYTKKKSNVGRNSNLETSRYIAKTYPDLLHSVDYNGYNAALHAASGGNVTVIKLLADKQVNVNKKNNLGCNILHMACANSKLEMCRYIIQTYPYLLDSVDNKGRNAAQHAAQGGNIKILQLLADNGVDVRRLQSITKSYVD